MFRRKETARSQTERVAEEVAVLRRHLAQSESRVAQLAADNAQLAADNAALRQRLEELERRLGLDSSTSSKPPSSDGPRKPPARRRTSSLRRKSKRKSGGQPGHKGTTLRRTATPDHVEEHWPQQCGDCGAPLSAADTVGQTVTRQVFDLPAQYGPRLAATAVYLQNFHLLPEDRLAELLRELFDVTLCAATVAAMTRKTAERWRGFAERLGAWIGTVARVKHLDETGFRICGRTQWLHVLCTPLLTFYRTSARRGAVGEGLRGCLVHDHWASYFRLEGVLHGLCNAHHLRELQALVKIDKEAWAGRMQRLLRRAALAVRIAQEKGVPLPRSLLERIRRRYDRLLEEALAYHRGLEPLPRGKRGRKKRRPGHNLALRLQHRKQSALRFLTDFEVPFSNNLAEQDVRMMKLRMKISGGFRSAQGARDFATLRSVLSTARKQGWNAIETLRTSPEELFARLQT